MKGGFDFPFQHLKHKPNLLRSSLLKYGEGFYFFSNNLIKVPVPCWVHFEVKRNDIEYIIDHSWWNTSKDKSYGTAQFIRH